LAHLCMAAICHDLGKKDIAPEIINKNGRLTDEEFEAVKMHPKFSYDILYERNDVPAVVRQAVLCHHENENGSGYPLGLGGEEIPLMAKIIHGVDVYDALVSKRPYKNPYSPAESFGYLKDGKGILFDEKVVDTMLKVIPAYMPGMDVELSNGERGLVIAHSNNIFRPVVKLYKDASTINLAEDPMFAHIWIVKTGGLEGSDHVGELNESRGNATEAKDVIVIVDDSVMTLMTSKKVLVGDYDVETFSDAIDAINYYTEGGKIDLMIMDIDMPRMSGIEGIRHLKKIGYDKPFIIMTGSRERETVLECKAIGATDYILKPAQPIYLKERVDAALKKYYDE
nr:response regulator [Eubacterium sp.]